MVIVEDLSKEEYAVLREYITNSEGIPNCRTMLTRDVWILKFRKHIHDVVQSFLYSTKFPNGTAPAGRRTSHLYGGVLKEADVCIMNRIVDGPHCHVDLPTLAIKVAIHSQPLEYLHWACATFTALSFGAVHLTLDIKIDLSPDEKAVSKITLYFWEIAGADKMNEAGECPPRGFFDRLIYILDARGTVEIMYAG
ncbi:uncharacterized protein ARMOST_02795 [Armillaria ostoyae]|uniref:Uncharacterized protein n=1 Tax=Armillaria ostoyae TaxID=47428 RepID=A0A284QSV9_ARMOS|nr:uncharacterized protein ARMOST_02795 [Armillaria ostoyae]